MGSPTPEEIEAAYKHGYRAGAEAMREAAEGLLETRLRPHICVTKELGGQVDSTGCVRCRAEAARLREELRKANSDSIGWMRDYDRLREAVEGLVKAIEGFDWWDPTSKVGEAIMAAKAALSPPPPGGGEAGDRKHGTCRICGGDAGDGFTVCHECKPAPDGGAQGENQQGGGEGRKDG